ncbi:MAG: universal stress protein [Nitrososphaerales archaeon]
MRKGSETANDENNPKSSRRSAVLALLVTAQVEKAPTNFAQKKQALEINRILVAVDGSENGHRAAQTAIKLAEDYNAEIVILRVVTAPTALTPTMQRAAASAIIKQFYDYAQKDATEYVDGLVAEAKNLGVRSRGEVVRANSSPVSAITDKAKSEGVDLIVIGTRGLDRPKRLFLGSVSSGVVANSDIQVLVVR